MQQVQVIIHKHNSKNSQKFLADDKILCDYW